MILPRPAGEGDREAVEGATASSMLKVAFSTVGFSPRPPRYARSPSPFPLRS